MASFSRIELVKVWAKAPNSRSARSQIMPWKDSSAALKALSSGEGAARRGSADRRREIAKRIPKVETRQDRESRGQESRLFLTAALRISSPGQAPTHPTPANQRARDV